MAAWHECDEYGPDVRPGGADFGLWVGADSDEFWNLDPPEEESWAS